MRYLRNALELAELTLHATLYMHETHVHALGVLISAPRHDSTRVPFTANRR